MKWYGTKLKEDENMESSKVFVLGQKISIKKFSKFWQNFGHLRVLIVNEMKL
jgi:hypothetical protein